MPRFYRKDPRPTSIEKKKPGIFWALAMLAVPSAGALTKMKLINVQNLPRKGAFILAPNHNSGADPFVLAVAVWRMGRAPRFMAKKSLFDLPFVGWVLRSGGMIPVDRKASREAAKHSLEIAKGLAEKGHGIISYPEGTLTKDPDLWPMRGKTGAVRLALEGNIPLIPMAQWGVQELQPQGGKMRWLPPRKRIKMIVGEPMDLEKYRNQPMTGTVLKNATAELMDKITELLGELRGETPPAERFAPDAKPKESRDNS